MMCCGVPLIVSVIFTVCLGKPAGGFSAVSVPYIWAGNQDWKNAAAWSAFHFVGAVWPGDVTSAPWMNQPAAICVP